MSEDYRADIRSNDPRVQAALNEYFAKVDLGESVEVEPFVAQHAEVAGELRSYIALDIEVRRMAQGAKPQPAAPPRSKGDASTQSVMETLQQTSPGQSLDALISPVVKSVVVKPTHDLPERFGRYRVRKKLGKGAMGAVYLAEDTLLQRRVALKTPTFDNDETGDLMKRFYREARAVANLKHPYLCAVYDVGEIDGRHYISMEFVPGNQLTEFISSHRPQGEKQALSAVRKIALAMHEAHTHGVIHRDLKPDNIMVNEKGEPVVMDFGLVHRLGSKSSSAQISKLGTLIGSPAYMSKEQVEGDHDKLTAATDQYSLGVILYQLLTSKLPFEGSVHAVLGAILTKEPPPPRQYRPDLNPHLEAVCLKMMAKSAEDRYPSMKAAAEALAEVARGTSTAAGAALVTQPAINSLSDGLIAAMPDIESAPAAKKVAKVDIGSWNEPLTHHGFQRPHNFASIPRSVLIGGLAAGAALLFVVVLGFQFSGGQKVARPSDDNQSTANADASTNSLNSVEVSPGVHSLDTNSNKPNSRAVVNEFDTEQPAITPGDKPESIAGKSPPAEAAKAPDQPVKEQPTKPEVMPLEPAPNTPTETLPWRPAKKIHALDLGDYTGFSIDPKQQRGYTVEQVGKRGGQIKQWNLDKGQLIQEIALHPDNTSVSICAQPFNSGTLLATIGSDSETLKIWDIEKKRLLSTTPIPARYPVAGTTSENRVVVAATDGVRIYECTQNGKATFIYHKPGKHHTAISALGMFYTPKDTPGAVSLFDITLKREAFRVEGHAGTIESLKLSEDGNRFITRSSDNTVRVTDAKTGVSLHRLQVPPAGLQNEIATSSDGRRRRSGMTRSPENPQNEIAISSDGRRAIIVGANGIPEEWLIDEERKLRDIPVESCLRYYYFANDLKLAVTTAKGLEIWELPVPDVLKK